jgi:hypothetical protein
MIWKRSVHVSLTVLAIVLLFTACSSSKSVSRIDNIDNAKVIRINSADITKSFTEKQSINKIVDYLGKIDIEEMSTDGEKKVLDGGKRLTDGTTYVVEVLKDENDNSSNALVYAILLSGKECIIVNPKTMGGNERSVSYLNSSDEQSLKPVSDVYAYIQDLFNQKQ